MNKKTFLHQTFTYHWTKNVFDFKLSHISYLNYVKISPYSENILLFPKPLFSVFLAIFRETFTLFRGLIEKKCFCIKFSHISYLYYFKISANLDDIEQMHDCFLVPIFCQFIYEILVGSIKRRWIQAHFLVLKYVPTK